MMERNFAEELDALKQKMDEMQSMLRMLVPEVRAGHMEPMANMHQNEHVSAVMAELLDNCNTTGSSGCISYMGVFASGGRASNWMRHDVSTDSLLPLIENRTADKVLACVGSNDRLNMLLAILRKPRTVAELVSDCGYTSTGQVYHHLKPLLTADLVVEDEHQRGSYIIQPHRVQGLIMLLAGIADLVDPTFTQGRID